MLSFYFDCIDYLGGFQWCICRCLTFGTSIKLWWPFGRCVLKITSWSLRALLYIMCYMHTSNEAEMSFWQNDVKMRTFQGTRLPSSITATRHNHGNNSFRTQLSQCLRKFKTESISTCFHELLDPSHTILRHLNVYLSLSKDWYDLHIWMDKTPWGYMQNGTS